MIHVTFYEPIGRRKSLSIDPDILRELLVSDANFEIRDTKSKKVIKYHAHDLLKFITYDHSKGEYTFPTNI